jgi:hypothetical protein
MTSRYDAAPTFPWPAGSRPEEYRADMAGYYDVVIGLHPDEALREVVSSAQVRTSSWPAVTFGQAL